MNRDAVSAEGGEQWFQGCRAGSTEQKGETGKVWGTTGGGKCSGQQNSGDVHAVAANELGNQEKPRVPAAPTWSRSPLRGAESKF